MPFPTCARSWVVPEPTGSAAAAKRRRASSRIPLLASRTRVLRYITRGSWKCSQSGETPCRTIIELVKAAKNMEMAATATQTPVSDFSACEPEAVTWPGRGVIFGGLPGPRSSTPRVVMLGGSVVVAIIGPLPRPRLLWRGLLRCGLHQVVLRTVDSVFIGTVVDHQVPTAKIVKGRRRTGGPLERSSFPGIFESNG